MIYLVDDFTGSGTSLIRNTAGGWKGKLVRFFNDLSELEISLYFDDNWSLCVHHYLATRQAALAIEQRQRAIRDERREKGEAWFGSVEFSYGMLLSPGIRVDSNRPHAFLELVENYYNPDVEAKDHNIEGGSEDIRYGYAQCRLPLVLDHNTPNNSFALLWAECGSKNGHAMRALLPTSPAAHMTEPGGFVMENPFYKRATEYLQDNDEFLSIVTPEPVLRFLKGPADSGGLFDRLVRVWGTPGSGKTTIARLFEFSVLSALARSRGLPSFKELAAAMVDCHALGDRGPVFLGCRIPLETSFRDFWELPYAESVRFRLFATFLQAKVALAWFRQLTDSAIPTAGVRIVAPHRPGSKA